MGRDSQRLSKMAKDLFWCDTARVACLPGRYDLIIGWKRESGNFKQETIAASGETLEGLEQSLINIGRKKHGGV